MPKIKTNNEEPNLENFTNGISRKELLVSVLKISLLISHGYWCS